VTNLRTKHMERHRTQAAKAFSGHSITKQSEGRWLLQRSYPDGRRDWTMAAEIICLEARSIYVGGDIDGAVFAYGPLDPVDRVRWIGECDDLGYYVAQKARIGSPRHPECVDEWNEDLAHQELMAFFDEVKAQDPELVHDANRFDGYRLECALSAESRHEFLTEAYSAFHGDFDIGEAMCGMGVVLSPSVIYAHAALARLCVLLRNEAKA
jgi:hypothetical protein